MTNIIISGIPLVDGVGEEILRVLSGTVVEVDADWELVRIFGDLIQSL
jgi:hypothetical protein